MMNIYEKILFLFLIAILNTILLQFMMNGSLIGSLIAYFGECSIFGLLFGLFLLQFKTLKN